jgi:hypothetical protein
MDTKPQTPIQSTTQVTATAPSPATAAPQQRSRRLTTIGIILMAAPAAILILLVLIYVILSNTPLVNGPNAAAIFLGGALFAGFVILLGIPIFIVGLILTISGGRKK